MSRLPWIVILFLCMAAGDLVAQPKSGEPPLPEGAIARLGTTRFRHGGIVHFLTVSPDGKLIGSGSDDKAYRVWNARTGELVHQFPTTQAYPYAIAFSPDGQSVATVPDSERILVHDLMGSGKPRAIDVALVQTVAWSADGKYLGLTSVEEDSACVLEAATGKLLQRIRKCGCIGLPKDGKRFAVAKIDASIEIHSMADGSMQQSLPLVNFNGNVSQITFHGDDRYLLAASTGGSTVLFDLTQNKQLWSIDAGGVPAAVSREKRFLTTQEGQVVSVAIPDGDISKLGIEAPPKVPVGLLPDNRTLAMGGPANRIALWDLKTAKEIPIGEGSRSDITGLSFSRDGKHLLSTGIDGMRLWDLKRQIELTDAYRPIPVQALAVSGEGDRFITTRPNELAFWNAVDLSRERPYADRPAFTVASKLNSVPFAAWSRDQRQFAFPDNENRIRLGDPAVGTVHTDLPMPAEPVAAAYSLSGRHLAVHLRSGWLRYWMLGSTVAGAPPSQELWTKRVQRNRRGAVAVSPDGMIVAVFSAGRVVLTDPINGRQWHAFERELFDGDVQTIVFSPDGRSIAVGHGGATGIVRVWDVFSGKAIAIFRGHVGGVQAIAFSPDGGTIASGGADTSILLWKLPGNVHEASASLSVDAACEALDHLDMNIAYPAMRMLRAGGKDNLSAIRDSAEKTRLKREEIRGWIRKLDDDDFRTRKLARTKIDEQGLRALPLLQDVRNRNPPAEVDRQLRLIIEEMEARGIRIPETGLYGEPLRLVRSILILEMIDTDEAWKIIESWATGPNDDPVSREARSALAYAGKRLPAVKK